MIYNFQFGIKYLLALNIVLVGSHVFAQADTPQLVYEKFIQNQPNDSLKVVAMYRWLTDNIAYDNRFPRRREGDTVLYQEPEQVVIRKKAVCIGYAKLFKEFCRLANIQAEVVYGRVKSNRQLQEEEHAWNVVKINAHWRLVDATWGAGGASAFYLFPTPSVLIESHLPHDPLWQLLENPISFNCFAYGERCQQPVFKVFSLKDSLAVWELSDSTQRAFAEAYRILLSNAEDIRAMRQLAAYFTDKATAKVLDYQVIRKAVQEKKRQANGRQSVLTLLDSAEFYLKQAISYYEKIQTYARKNRYTDAHLNADILYDNLKTLAEERAFVEKYFKQ